MLLVAYAEGPAWWELLLSTTSRLEENELKKTLLVLGCCAAIASAEVVVGDKTDPIDGHRNVILAIEGDGVFSSATEKPTLAVSCEVRRGKAHKPRLVLDAKTVIVDRVTGGRGEYSALLHAEMVHIEYRFDQDAKPHLANWVKFPRPGSIWSFDNGFFQKMLGPSKKVYVQIATFQGGAATVGFDLTGFAEAFSKQDVCKDAK